jgi:hypothetical protein
MDAAFCEKPKGGINLAALMLLALVVTAIIVFATMVKEVANPNDAHPVERHFADAVIVEQGCSHNGVWAVYREQKSKDVFHQVCKLDDGRWGDWIVRKIVDASGKVRYETVTRFIPKDGTLTKVQEYILKKATLFKGAW